MTQRTTQRTSQRINERQERMKNIGKFGKVKGLQPGLDKCTTTGERIQTNWGTKEEKLANEKKRKDEKALYALYDMVLSRKYSGEEIVAAYDSIIEEKYDAVLTEGNMNTAKYVPPQRKIGVVQTPVLNAPPKQRSPNTVKIFDIPCDYTKEDISCRMEKAGQIKYVKLLVSDERYLGNNTAIIEFRTLLGAKNAIEMFDRKAWNGSLISVKLLR